MLLCFPQPTIKPFLVLIADQVFANKEGYLAKAVTFPAVLGLKLNSLFLSAPLDTSCTSSQDAFSPNEATRGTWHNFLLKLCYVSCSWPLKKRELFVLYLFDSLSKNIQAVPTAAGDTPAGLQSAILPQRLRGTGKANSDWQCFCLLGIIYVVTRWVILTIPLWDGKMFPLFCMKHCKTAFNWEYLENQQKNLVEDSEIPSLLYILSLRQTVS